MSQQIQRVALVIPVHNRRETTRQALRSLARINRDNLIIRIFVVDDGSSDGTTGMIRQNFPEVRIIEGDGTLHYAAGTNRGIEAALDWNPDFVVIMNDDAVFHDRFLSRLVETARANPRSVVGSLLLMWSDPHRVFQVGQRWKTWHGGWEIPEDLTAFTVPVTPFQVECIVGNCALIPVGAIDECGLLDEEKFPHGWGDAQYMVRLRKAGWNLLVDPKSLVWCEPNTYPPSLHSLPFSEIWKVLFTDERHPANLKRQFVARWESAPTKTRAYAAFGFYCIDLTKKAIAYFIERIFRRSAQTI